MSWLNGPRLNGPRLTRRWLTWALAPNLQADVVRLESDRERLGVQVADLEAKREELSEVTTRLDALAEFETVTLANEDRANAARADAIKATADLQRLNDEVADLRAEQARLQQLVVAAEDSEKRAEEANATLADVRGELSRENERLGAANADLAQVDAEIAEKRALSARTQADFTAAELAELARADSELQAIKAREELTSELAQLEQARADLARVTSLLAGINADNAIAEKAQQDGLLPVSWTRR